MADVFILFNFIVEAITSTCFCTVFILIQLLILITKVYKFREIDSLSFLKL